MSRRATTLSTALVALAIGACGQPAKAANSTPDVPANQTDKCSGPLSSPKFQGSAEAFREFYRDYSKSGEADFMKRLKDNLVLAAHHQPTDFDPGWLPKDDPRLGKLREALATELKAVEEMDAKDVRTCFPALVGFLNTAVQNDQERQKQQQAQAEQRRLVQEQQRAQERQHAKEMDDLYNGRSSTEKRVVELAETYAHYIFVRRCHDLRVGYAVVYISDHESEQARVNMRKLQDKIKTSEIDLDHTWALANKYVDYIQNPRTQNNRDFCQKELAEFNAKYKFWFRNEIATKKDF